MCQRRWISPVSAITILLLASISISAEEPADWAGKRVEALVDLGFDINMTGFQCEALAYRVERALGGGS